MTGRRDHDYSCGGGGSPRSGLSCSCLSTMFGKLLVHLVNTRLPSRASPRWRMSFRRSYPVKPSACCEAIPISVCQHQKNNNPALTLLFLQNTSLLFFIFTEETWNVFLHGSSKRTVFSFKGVKPCWRFYFKVSRSEFAFHTTMEICFTMFTLF